MAYSVNLPVGGCVEVASARGGALDMFSAGTSTRLFAVRSPDKTYDETYALLHADVPTIGAPHPNRSGLRLLNKNARQADDRNGEIWEVTCQYGFALAEFPWQEPPVYQWGSQSTEQIVDYDVATKKPIKNSAGAPFDPGVTATRFEATLTVSRNEIDFNQAYTSQYTGAVNKSKFYGANPGFVMCTGIPATTQYYIDQRGQRTRYWSVQYIFAFRNQFSWQPKILDAGYMKKSGSGGLIPITIAGREPSSPVPLDGDGQPLANPDTDEPNWLDFKTYPELDFSALKV